MLSLILPNCRVTPPSFDWLPVLEVGGLLTLPFEKQEHAMDKYRGENFFSPMHGQRSLRATGEQVSLHCGAYIDTVFSFLVHATAALSSKQFATCNLRSDGNCKVSGEAPLLPLTAACMQSRENIEDPRTMSV